MDAALQLGDWVLDVPVETSAEAVGDTLLEAGLISESTAEALVAAAVHAQQRLAIARVKRGLSRSIVATAKHRAFTVLYTSRRATRKIMKRGIAKARTWIINKGLVDRRFRESQLVLPPMQDFVNDADSVSSVDSDPHGERYSTAPERAFWPCVVALDDGWHALLLVLGLA